jgi:predicted GNAT family N-acyltransferase
MKIRKATKKDINKLVTLDKIANKEIKWWCPMTASEFSKLIKKSMVYVVEDKGDLIAYLNGDIREKQLVMDNVYIKKEFRNKGLGKKLIKIFISEWKSKFKAVRIDCPERLRKFYEKLGFRVTGLIMKRKLR